MQTKKNSKNQKKVPQIQKSLIIIDAQNDFCAPEGALYVKDSENIIPVIIDYVNNNKNVINQIIFTKNWHVRKDEMFEKNGGEWPMHCIQKTNGAEINKTLYDALVQFRIPITIVNKGTVYDYEEWGAFEHCGTFHHLHPNIDPIVKNCFFANSESSSGSRILNNDIVICGVPGDYSVKETIENLLNHWRFNVEVLMDAIASMDDGTTLNEYIEEKHLKMI